MRQYAALCILSLGLVSSGYPQDTVNVKTGWNIIGSVKAGAVPDVLTTIPDSIIKHHFSVTIPDPAISLPTRSGRGSGTG